MLARFAEIARQLNIEHIFVLVDRVDELVAVFDYQRIVDMLKPLVQTVPLLEMSTYAFKFFLPLEIHDMLALHIRADRFPIYLYESSELWDKMRLKRLLETRLDFFCDPKLVPDAAERKNFKRLFEDEIKSSDFDIVDEMIKVVNGPRDLLRLVSMIISEHTKLPPIQLKISKETYQWALAKFIHEKDKIDKIL